MHCLSENSKVRYCKLVPKKPSAPPPRVTLDHFFAPKTAQASAQTSYTMKKSTGHNERAQIAGNGNNDAQSRQRAGWNSNIPSTSKFVDPDIITIDDESPVRPTSKSTSSASKSNPSISKPCPTSKKRNLHESGHIPNSKSNFPIPKPRPIPNPKSNFPTPKALPVSKKKNLPQSSGKISDSIADIVDGLRGSQNTAQNSRILSQNSRALVQNSRTDSQFELSNHGKETEVAPEFSISSTEDARKRKAQEEADFRMALELSKAEQIENQSKYFGSTSTTETDNPGPSTSSGTRHYNNNLLPDDFGSVPDDDDDELILLAALDYEKKGSDGFCLRGPSTSMNFATSQRSSVSSKTSGSGPISKKAPVQFITRDSSSESLPVGEPQEELEGFDNVAGRTWIYPSLEKMEIREYQKSIIRSSLFNNTLVCLPTGLGKTFIAAVVMFNFYRWYATGKIVFLAPTRPLVDQQIEACYKIMGIPQCDMIDLTGSRAPELRRNDWVEKRMFFMTPQTMASDLGRGVVPVRNIRCVVVDEAHKATGNHAYVQVVRGLKSMNHSQFRVLALSATPGSDGKKVQEIIRNLLISKTEIRTDQSMDIVPYVHGRDLRKEVVRLSPEIRYVVDTFERGLKDYLEKLVKAKVLYSADPSRYSTFQLLQAAQKAKQEQRNIQNMKLIQWYFAFLQSMFFGYDVLLRHGMRCLYASLKDTLKHKAQVAMELGKNPHLAEMWSLIESKFSDLSNVSLDTSKLGVLTPGNVPGTSRQDPTSPTKLEEDLEVAESSHPKLPRLREILEEFFRSKQDAQVMVFSSFRNSVAEIVDYLKRFRPLIKPAEFKGQSSGPKKPTRKKANKEPGKKGRPKAKKEEIEDEDLEMEQALIDEMDGGKPEEKKPKNKTTQKKQLQTIQNFKNGEFNVLVSTCVGEEGLDIGEVDMIINYDCPTSATRLVQRMGRTGRKRHGQIIVLVTEGKEESMYYRSQMGKKRATDLITNAKGLEFYEDNPRMVPRGLNPMMTQQVLQAKPDYDKNVRKKQPGARKHGLLTELEEARYKRFYQITPESSKDLKSIGDIHAKKLLALQTKPLDKLSRNDVQNEKEVDMGKYSMYQWDVQASTSYNSGFRVDSSARSHDLTYLIGQAQKSMALRVNPGKGKKRSTVTLDADPDRWARSFRPEDVLAPGEIEYTPPDIDLNNLQAKKKAKPKRGKEALLLIRAAKERQLASQILSADRKFQLMASGKAAARAKHIAQKGVPKRNLLKGKKGRRKNKVSEILEIESEYRPPTPPLTPDCFLDLDAKEGAKRKAILDGMISEIEDILAQKLPTVEELLRGNSSFLDAWHSEYAAAETVRVKHNAMIDDEIAPSTSKVDFSSLHAVDSVKEEQDAQLKLAEAERILESMLPSTSFDIRPTVPRRKSVQDRTYARQQENHQSPATKPHNESDDTFWEEMDFEEIDALAAACKRPDISKAGEPSNWEHTPMKDSFLSDNSRQGSRSNRSLLSSGMSENTAINFLMDRSGSRDSINAVPFSPSEALQIKRNLSGVKRSKGSFAKGLSIGTTTSGAGRPTSLRSMHPNAKSPAISSSNPSVFKTSLNIVKEEVCDPDPIQKTSLTAIRSQESPKTLPKNSRSRCDPLFGQDTPISQSMNRLKTSQMKQMERDQAKFVAKPSTSRSSYGNLDFGFDFDSPSPPPQEDRKLPYRKPLDPGFDFAEPLPMTQDPECQVGNNSQRPPAKRLSGNLDLGFSFDSSPSPPPESGTTQEACCVFSDSNHQEAADEKPHSGLTSRRVSTDLALGFSFDSPSPPLDTRPVDSPEEKIAAQCVMPHASTVHRNADPVVKRSRKSIDLTLGFDLDSPSPPPSKESDEFTATDRKNLHINKNLNIGFDFDSPSPPPSKESADFKGMEGKSLHINKNLNIGFDLDDMGATQNPNWSPSPKRARPPKTSRYFAEKSGKSRSHKLNDELSGNKRFYSSAKESERRNESFQLQQSSSESEVHPGSSCEMPDAPRDLSTFSPLKSTPRFRPLPETPEQEEMESLDFGEPSPILGTLPPD